MKPSKTNHGSEARTATRIEKIFKAVADFILCMYTNPNKPFTLYPDVLQV